MSRANEQRKLSELTADRHFIDCLRHVLGFDNLYDVAMPEEEYQDKRRNESRIRQKPWSMLTDAEKEIKRAYTKAWRQRNKDAGLTGDGEVRMGRNTDKMHARNSMSAKRQWQSEAS